jgi:tetratricopeptide (TPR) repeat protein
MILDDIPFDLTFHFDAELREVPERPDEYRRAVAWLQERAADPALGERERVRLLGRCGVLARTVGDYPAALDALQAALAGAARLGDERLELISRVRLAHVYQWQRDFARSDALFAEALRGCETDPACAGVRDSVYQHAGKNLFDQGRYAEALALFERALALRLGSGDAELIASARLAADTARERLGGAS